MLPYINWEDFPGFFFAPIRAVGWHGEDDPPIRGLPKCPQRIFFTALGVAVWAMNPAIFRELKNEELPAIRSNEELCPKIETY